MQTEHFLLHDIGITPRSRVKFVCNKGMSFVKSVHS